MLTLIYYVNPHIHFFKSNTIAQKHCRLQNKMNLNLFVGRINIANGFKSEYLECFEFETLNTNKAPIKIKDTNHSTYFPKLCLAIDG